MRDSKAKIALLRSLVFIGCVSLHSMCLAALVPLHEPLAGGSLPGSLTEADTTTASRNILYGPTGAQFGAASTGDNGRNYIRTVDADYHTTSFSAYITVNANPGPASGSNYGNSEQVFFGLGSGNVGQFGVPDRQTNNDSIHMEFNSGSGNNSRRWRVNTVNEGALTEGLSQLEYPVSVLTDTHRLRLDFDSVLQTVAFAVDFDYVGGPFVADQTGSAISVAGLIDNVNGWGFGDPARVFFGADSNSTTSPALVRDFAIVGLGADPNAIPEPATASLALLGMGGLMMRRRRMA